MCLASGRIECRHLFPCHWDKKWCKLTKYSGFVSFNLLRKNKKEDKKTKHQPQNTAKLSVAALHILLFSLRKWH